MPLPRKAYGGAWRTTNGTEWDDTTAHAPGSGGWVSVPAEFSALDSDLLVLDAGKVRLQVTAERLPALVAAKVSQIDSRTRELIAQGFGHAGKQFSLSLAAQLNWSNVPALAASLAYPHRAPTIDDGCHDFVDQAELLAAYQAGVSAKQAHRAAGLDLKIAAKAATSLAELYAVEDSR